MSYVTLTISILMFVNLFVFLAGQPAANAPMLGLISAYMSGTSINWLAYINYGSLFGVGTLIGLIVVVIQGLSLGSNPLTGSTFGGVHALTVIATALAFSMVGIPNFAYMGLPGEIAFLLTTFMSFMVALSVLGIFKGE